MAEKYVSIVATVVLIAAAAALVLGRSILGKGPFSIAIQIAGLLLVVWARFTFGFRSFHVAANPTRGPLITSGPYRYIRNPIYAAVLLMCWPGIAAHWSIRNVVLGIMITASLAVKIWCEEQLLRSAYPDYREYAQRTARLFPRIL